MNFLSYLAKRLRDWNVGSAIARLIEQMQQPTVGSLGYCRSADCGRLAVALAAAQGAMRAPKKNQTATVRGTSKGGGPVEYSYTYADLAELIDAARAPLSANELAYVQAVSFEATSCVCVTELLHGSGQWLRTTLRYPFGENGKSQVQDFGILSTYLKRYALGAVLGIAAERDTDGRKSKSGADNPVRQQARADEAGKWDANVTEDQVRFFYKDFKPLASLRFPNWAVAEQWIRDRVLDITKCRKRDLNDMIQAVKSMPILEKPETRIEEDARPSIQRRWSMCFQKKGLTIEEASWWAQSHFGWVHDPVKGRASASCSPLADVKNACWALEKARPAEIDKIKHDYALAVDDRRRA